MKVVTGTSDNLTPTSGVHIDFIRTPPEKAMQFVSDHGDEVRAHIKKCKLCAHKYQETIDLYVESLPENRRIRLRAMACAVVKALTTKN